MEFSNSQTFINPWPTFYVLSVYIKFDRDSRWFHWWLPVIPEMTSSDESLKISPKKFSWNFYLVMYKSFCFWPKLTKKLRILKINKLHIYLDCQIAFFLLWIVDTKFCRNSYLLWKKWSKIKFFRDFSGHSESSEHKKDARVTYFTWIGKVNFSKWIAWKWKILNELKSIF
jgi:hypothetical protein